MAGLVIICLVFGMYTFVSSSITLSSIKTKSYAGYIDSKDQVVSLYIHTNKSELKEAYILIFSSQDKYVKFLEIPLDIYFPLNNSYTKVDNLYSLKYLTRGEEEAVQSTIKIINNTYHININKYINIYSEFKNDLSSINKTDNNKPLPVWTKNFINKTDNINFLMNSGEYKNASKNFVTSFEKEKLLSLMKSTKEIKDFQEIKINRNFLNEKLIEVGKVKVYDETYFSSVVSEALKEESIQDEQAKIEVFNATPVEVLGSESSSVLKNYSMNVSKINNLSKYEQKTKVYVQSDKKYTVNKISQLLNNPEIVYSTSPYISIADIVIVLGNDSVK